MSTRVQSSLLQFLHERDTDQKDDAIQWGLTRTVYGFVLRYGWFYQPCRLPTGHECGEHHQCYTNAFDLLLKGKTLIYCEGFAMAKGATTPMDHAWLTDGTGRAIDPTWTMDGVAYAGVPFKRAFVLSAMIRNMPVEGFIGDGKNNYPLLCGLGERPAEWLEEAGKGMEKLEWAGGYDLHEPGQD